MIGGRPMRWGGQIAECITVKLVKGATDPGAVANDRIECVGQASVLRSDSGLLRAIDVGTYIPPGLMPAFSEPHTAREHPFFKESRFQPTCLRRQA
jgi:hypothetical protein